MTDRNISSASAGMPAPGWCSGSEKLGVHLGRGIARRRGEAALTMW